MRAKWFESAEQLEGALDVAQLLEHAARQAKERRLGDFLIVDADFHHYESQNWTDILDNVEDPVLRYFLQSGSRGRFWLPGYTMSSDMQDVSGRLLPERVLLREGAGGGPSKELQLIECYMQMMSIDYAMLFPTPMLVLGLIPRADVEVAVARAYARWVTENVLAANPAVRSLLYLPFNDPEASLRLIQEFGTKPGVVGFMVCSVRYRPVHHNGYMKVYAALEERGLPIAFHSAFNLLERPMQEFNNFLSVHAIGFPFYNMVNLTNWITNGLPERFPRLKVIWMESGLAWIPFMMQRLDHEYMMRSSEAPLLKRKPSDYMRDFYYTSQPMEFTGNLDALKLTFEMINAENQLLFASDWPHWDFDLPSKIYDLPFLSDKARRNILGENARRLFRLPEERPVAARTVRGTDEVPFDRSLSGHRTV